jgi:hypothetical protein
MQGVHHLGSVQGDEREVIALLVFDELEIHEASLDGHKPAS